MTQFTETIYRLFQSHPSISTDTRNILPGSIFFSLKGEHFDGNKFASAALERGSSYAIVDDLSVVKSDRFILVEDTLKELQSLATFHRNRFRIPLIAITGTNGKTTTKELIRTVLEQKYRTVSTSGNLNNHIGVPLTLLKITPESEIAIIEMGANHPGEIDFLCRIANPGYGIITNIGRAHLEGFGSMESVIKTKTELYRFLDEVGGTVFLNTNNSLLKKHVTGFHISTYGSPPAEVTVRSSEADPYVNAEIRLPGCEDITIRTKLYGKYNVSNIAAAACIGHFFQVPADLIKRAIEGYEPANNRSQIMMTRSNRLILDAYNANPSSMEEALVAFAETSFSEKILILGDMLELGTNSDQEHQHILRRIGELGLKRVFLVGPIFCRNNTLPEYHGFTDAALAKLWFEHHRPEQATILIKGSRGMQLETLVDTL